VISQSLYSGTGIGSHWYLKGTCLHCPLCCKLRTALLPQLYQESTAFPAFQHPEVHVEMLTIRQLHPGIKQAIRRKTPRPGTAPGPWLQLSAGFNSKGFGRACLKPLQEARPPQEFAGSETGGVASFP